MSALGINKFLQAAEKSLILNQVYDNNNVNINDFIKTTSPLPPLYNFKVEITPQELISAGNISNPTIRNAGVTVGSTLRGPGANIGTPNSKLNTGGIYNFKLQNCGHLRKLALKFVVNLRCYGNSTYLTNKYGGYSLVEKVILLINNLPVEIKFGRELFALDNMTAQSSSQRCLELACWRNRNTSSKMPIVYQTNYLQQKTSTLGVSDVITQAGYNCATIDSNVYSEMPLVCYLEVHLDALGDLSKNFDTRTLNNASLQVYTRPTFTQFREGIQMINTRQTYVQDTFTNWCLFSTHSSWTVNSNILTTGCTKPTSDFTGTAYPSVQTRTMKSWDESVSVTETISANTDFGGDSRRLFSHSAAASITDFGISLICYHYVFDDDVEQTLYNLKNKTPLVESLSTSCYAEEPLILNTASVISSTETNNVLSDSALNAYTNTLLLNNNNQDSEAFMRCETHQFLNSRHLTKSISSFADIDHFPLHFMLSVSNIVLKDTSETIYSASGFENCVLDRWDFSLDVPDKNINMSSIFRERELEGCSVQRQGATDVVSGTYYNNHYLLPIAINTTTLSADYRCLAIPCDAALQYSKLFNRRKSKALQNFAFINFSNTNNNIQNIAGSLGLSSFVAPKLEMIVQSNDSGTYVGLDYKLFTYVTYLTLQQTNSTTGNVQIISDA